jgi:hypothetical protein
MATQSVGLPGPLATATVMFPPVVTVAGLAPFTVIVAAGGSVALSTSAVTLINLSGFGTISRGHISSPRRGFAYKSIL